METLLRRLCQVSLLLVLVAWWRQDRFVPVPLPSRMDAPPAQQAVERPGFSARHAGVAYEVLPSHRYELVGQVVSLRLHDGNTGIHRRWNDHLNVADVCVIWGGNARQLDLNAFEFHNLEFTCYFGSDDAGQWRRFRPDEIANNHLISDDPALREALAGIRIGDVIRLRGYLAHYGVAGQPRSAFRGTSTSRSDRGNGACETIWVTEFERLARMPNPWRPTLKLALALLLFGGAAWLWGVGSGRFPHRLAASRRPAPADLRDG